jgi:hypothetical protein
MQTLSEKGETMPIRPHQGDLGPSEQLTIQLSEDFLAANELEILNPERGFGILC